MCSGTGRFDGYGTLMGTDGMVRLGVRHAGPVGVKPVPTASSSASRRRRSRSPARRRPARPCSTGPEASWRELTPNLGWLLAGSVSSAALLNAGPIAASLLATRRQSPGQQLSTGVFIARVPLFLFQAVQAALLPKLARLAAPGALDRVPRGFRKLLRRGRRERRRRHGRRLPDRTLRRAGPLRRTLSRRTLTLLALSSALYMVALALAQAVIALRGHARWPRLDLGIATFLAVAAIAGDDLLLRVELALVVGSAVALVLFAFALRARIRAGAEPDEDSLVEALHDLPLEP